MIKIKATLIVILSIFIVSCSFRKGPEPEITPVLDEQLSYADSIESNPDQSKTSESRSDSEPNNQVIKEKAHNNHRKNHPYKSREKN